MNIAKFDLELRLVPLVVDIFAEVATGSAFDDNCFNLFAKLVPLQFTTTLTKNIATCGLNLRDLIDKADSYMDVPRLAMNMDEIRCEFNEDIGDNRQ